MYLNTKYCVENVFKYKILCGKMYLNTNTKYCVEKCI